MGRSSEEYIRLKQEESNVDDRDYQNEQWKIGPIEVVFSRTYMLSKTGVSKNKNPYEDFDDAIERQALEMFNKDLPSLAASADNFDIHVDYK